MRATFLYRVVVIVSREEIQRRTVSGREGVARWYIDNHHRDCKPKKSVKAKEIDKFLGRVWWAGICMFMSLCTSFLNVYNTHLCICCFHLSLFVSRSFFLQV